MKLKIKNYSSAFTLLELLIVIGILAVISVTMIIVINPVDLLARARDSNRINDLSAVNTAINVLMSFYSNASLGTANTLYVSLPSNQADCSDLGLPALPGTWVYHCVTEANLRKVDANGWIPINFTQMDIGSPLSSLPVDPKNIYAQDLSQANDFFFTYAINSSNQWELNAKTESTKFGFVTRDGFPINNAASTPSPVSDGGDNGLYEIGSSLTVIPDSGGLCPTGMVYVPAPARICIDKYEVSYSAAGTKPDGSACSSNCPLSQYNATPWVSVSQLNAIPYCQNMGKVLPSDYEWFIAVAGTPDPHTSDPADDSEPCNIWANSKPSGSTWSVENQAIKTGTASKCISTNGAYDMIGNVWEWVNDTKSTSDVYSSGNTAVPNSDRTIAYINDYGVPIASGGSSCSGVCNSDYYWVASGTLTAGLRSGDWTVGAVAGRFALNLGSAPSSASSGIGFRCALR